MKNYTEVRFRVNDNDYYLIPIGDVDNFDKFSELINELEYDNDRYDDYLTMCSDFDNEYRQYLYEGDIFNLPLFIKD